MGLAWKDDTLWLASRIQMTGTALHTSTDNQTFTDILLPENIKDLPSCPGDSDSELICRPLWETLEENLAGFGAADTGDTGTPASADGGDGTQSDTGAAQDPAPVEDTEAKAGCGCAATTPSPGWLAWLGMLVLLRRRD